MAPRSRPDPKAEEEGEASAESARSEREHAHLLAGSARGERARDEGGAAAGHQVPPDAGQGGRGRSDEVERGLETRGQPGAQARGQGGFEPLAQIDRERRSHHSLRGQERGRHRRLRARVSGHGDEFPEFWTKRLQHPPEIEPLNEGEDQAMLERSVQ